MKLTRTQLRKIILEAMYDPRQGLKKRQQAYDAMPLSDRQAIDPYLSSNIEDSRVQGHDLVDTLTGYEGRESSLVDKEEYEMIDINYLFSNIPELARVKDEIPDVFDRIMHAIHSGHIIVEARDASIVPTLSDMSTIQVRSIVSGGPFDPETTLTPYHWKQAFLKMNQNHPAVGRMQHFNPLNIDESQEASRKLVQFMLDQGAQVDLKIT